MALSEVRLDCGIQGKARSQRGRNSHSRLMRLLPFPLLSAPLSGGSSNSLPPCCTQLPSRLLRCAFRFVVLSPPLLLSGGNAAAFSGEDSEEAPSVAEGDLISASETALLRTPRTIKNQKVQA